MISIFSKPAFLNVNSSVPFVYEGKKPKRGHLMRVSSMIRADQIAEEIGAKLNPEDGYSNDVCIYVKPHIKKGTNEFNFEGRKNYIDIIDGHNLGQVALNYPDVGVIVCSEADAKTMKKVVPNEVVFIPQHHCNFDNLRRDRTGITRVGVIGTRDAFPHLPQTLRADLTERGIELVEFSDFYSREDIVNFYMSIDLQIVWRPYKKLLSNPLKLVNAASFGIPTIALDEVAFKELGAAYAPVNSYSHLLNEIEYFKLNPSYYHVYSERCLREAKRYHINEVGKLYKNLDK